MARRIVLATTGVCVVLALARALGTDLPTPMPMPADATGMGIMIWKTQPVGIPCSQPTPCRPPDSDEGGR